MGFIIREPQPDTLTEVEEPEPIVDLLNRKLCPCGKMFTPYRAFQRYHNDDCRVKFEKRRPSRYVKKVVSTVKCGQCGKEFQTNDGKRAYCSKECYLKHEEDRHVEAEERACLQCGTKFTTAHWAKRYCSSECRREARHVR